METKINDHKITICKLHVCHFQLNLILPIKQLEFVLYTVVWNSLYPWGPVFMDSGL